MSTIYTDKLSIMKLNATVKISNDRASVSSEIQIRNTGNKPLAVELEATRPGISNLNTRTVAARPKMLAVPLKNSPLPSVSTLAKKLELKPNEMQILDLDHTDVILGDRVKTYMYIPNLAANKLQLLQKVPEFKVSVQLPKKAKRLISSSIKPSRIIKNEDGMICDFTQRDAYPIPVTIKWTERDENIGVTKSTQKLSGNRLKVTIRLRNNGTTAAKNVTVLDQYSTSEVEPVSGQGLKKTTYNNKDPRVEFCQTVNLNPAESLSLSYIVKPIDIQVQVPATVVSINNNIVAISPLGPVFNFPPPPPAPKTALALPSGWGFDYINGGDHHLNEHGMWCNGQNYDSAHERLSWNTGCIYADKNFDDDYRWTAAHQIIRFNPGFSHQGTTPWLAKTGSTTTHTDEFQHNSLKQFSNAVVLLSGWRFDFTSNDHHINKMSIKLTTNSFSKSAGRVRWNTMVTYADKNFDDNYRYLYYYTILAFDGAMKTASFSGTDKGGTAAHMGSITNDSLKGYSNAIVLPVGWSFDYTSNDHHINEHNFKIQNVKYNSSTGKVEWSAHFNYSDKNFDDDYNWSYNVVVIATNNGESREYSSGPYTDNGGLDSKNYAVQLSSIFKPITWTNGIKDGDETGVDCGGSSPARDMHSLQNNVEPGNGSSSGYFSLKNANQQNVVKTFATIALLEYAQHLGQNYDTFYSGPEKPDRYIEAVAWYVDRHMEYVKDGGSWSGAQSAYRTLTESGHRGSKDFAGDCEDHAILRAALLRSLGMRHNCVFCADHHNSVDQGQKEECHGDMKKSGGHTYNIVVYKGKYRIMDYGAMRPRYWANLQCWDQHVTDNIWNDHTGKHWSNKDTSPYGSSNPLVNYPGNPISPGGNWDWRTYFNDITP